MVDEISFIANPVIGESPLPDFSAAAEDVANGVGESALDELHRMFERNVIRRGQQQMDMFRHHDKGMQCKAAFASIAIDRLQEEAGMVLDHEKPSTLPGGTRDEIRSRRGDESYRLQGQTSAAEAASFTHAKSARVKLVPFPVDFSSVYAVLGKRG